MFRSGFRALGLVPDFRGRDPSSPSSAAQSTGQRGLLAPIICPKPCDLKHLRRNCFEGTIQKDRKTASGRGTTAGFAWHRELREHRNVTLLCLDPRHVQRRQRLPGPWTRGPLFPRLAGPVPGGLVCSREPTSELVSVTVVLQL